MSVSVQERLQDMWSSDSQEYDEIVERQLRNHREVRHWRHELGARLGDRPLDVVDVGCGPGFFSVMLGRLGHRVTSIDSSEGMIGAARGNLRWNGVDADVRRGDVVALDGFEAGSVDAIVSRDVVWTLHDPAAAYRRWMEVLRPGGVVLVYDGNYRRDRTGLRHGAWVALSRVLVRVTEGRPSSEGHGSSGDPTAELPSVTAERPELDLALLREAGYIDVSAEPDTHRMSLRNLEFWKYGYQGGKFIVTARKPS
ncbi:class I SAM-dependent methyltransferase [Acidipropionibacterium virtanenii]|uniref:Putative S-adenosylmethionine-dependent methyltransferase/MSMEI_2290 n=1 Tax=Acidipropionibacterium virtanenii TaxID=2057246 RepID=A0A344UPP3_9ACTN|nr:class I SAM-dependent methyltransferase [Acidipropionibacterium virtanenii]AXE37241.1 putative S-adenosylmethionine-dependent methyltransferase/MSMEI_2290 [Acidipropionibacterium virtanenii]